MKKTQNPGLSGWISQNSKMFVFLMFVMFAVVTITSSIIIAFLENKEAVDLLFPVLTGWAGMFVGFILRAAGDFGLDGNPDDQSEK